MELSKYIRSIPDYPKKGILFRDITTLIKNKEAFKETIDQLVKLASKIKFEGRAFIGGKYVSFCISS